MSIGGTLGMIGRGHRVICCRLWAVCCGLWVVGFGEPKGGRGRRGGVGGGGLEGKVEGREEMKGKGEMVTTEEMEGQGTDMQLLAVWGFVDGKIVACHANWGRDESGVWHGDAVVGGSARC